MSYYILDYTEKPKETHDIHEWARWMDKNKRHLTFRTTIRPGVDVSTTFLGIDHRFSEGGRPILWETMVFGGVCDGDMTRYMSAEESRAGHMREVERVKAEEQRVRTRSAN